MTDLLATIPATESQASTESIPWGLDVAPLLAAGEMPTNASCLLTDLATGVNYAAGLSGPPAILGTVITQTVTTLVAGHTYNLIYTFQAAPGKIFSPAVRIACPR